MPISMSLAAHYVTQKHVWGIPFKGILTDRAIERYRKAGYYGPVVKEERKKKQQRKHKKHFISKMFK